MLQQISIAKQREIIAKNNNEIAAKQYKAGLISITERLTAENDIYKESLNKIETIIKQRQAAIETYQSAGSLMSFITIHRQYEKNKQFIMNHIKLGGLF